MKFRRGFWVKAVENCLSNFLPLHSIINYNFFYNKEIGLYYRLLGFNDLS